MLPHKILMSNLGYASGISGSLAHHVRYAHRHIYCSPAVQEKTLQQVKALIAKEDPDICCFVEIDKGSFTSGNFNQLESLLNEKYTSFDIENKYGAASHLRRFALTRGKSNAFIAKRIYPHEKIHFSHGTKRLVYKLQLDPKVTLFFAHFSLKKEVREQQLLQVRHLIEGVAGEVIFLGDFNVLTGLGEIKPLLQDTALLLLNREDHPTFSFHKRRLVLDLCLCSPGIAQRSQLKVIPQPYSDHAALLLEVGP